MYYITTNFAGNTCMVFYTSTANGALEWLELLRNSWPDEEFNVTQDKPESSLSEYAPATYDQYRRHILFNYNRSPYKPKLVVMEGGKA